MGAPDLYARQRVLAEIGERGQARLSSARFAPSADLGPPARAHAVLYARAAGFGETRDAHEHRGSPLAVHFRHSSARDLALGAADVLNQALLHFDLGSSHQHASEQCLAQRRSAQQCPANQCAEDLPPPDLHHSEK